jgi:hypothetical protein
MKEVFAMAETEFKITLVIENGEVVRAFGGGGIGENIDVAPAQRPDKHKYLTTLVFEKTPGVTAQCFTWIYIGGSWIKIPTPC